MRYGPISPALFVENRARLVALLEPGTLAILNANDILPTNADGTLRLIQNSDLFYLTGVEQEETVLLLFPNAADERFREVLFLRETNDEIAIWEGAKLTKEQARERTGIVEVRWTSELPEVLRKLMCECAGAYLNLNEHSRADTEVQSRDARFIRDLQARYPLHRYHRLAPLLAGLRMRKSPAEVELIRKACALTERGFRRVCSFVKPGVNEMEIEAEFAHEFIRAGGSFAYEPIVASGANACVLHYVQNDQRCQKGDLLLLDVGARYANYMSDLTRTIPVSGRFSKRQKQVYEAVLRVLRASIAAAVPGVLPKAWLESAQALMEKELVDLGLLTTKEIRKQDPQNKALRKFFPHGLGHLLGLDVHDVGSMYEPLAPGMVFTVEPGIYIPKEGLGVRLENDILITDGAPIDLMATIPLECDEIEAAMAAR